MIRTILHYPDKRLREPGKKVAAITPELQKLIDDMAETMYAAPGIGLAAPQVGVALRIFVADVSGGRNRADLLTFINPEIVERDGTQREDEVCLSVPGFNATVARSTRVVLKGLARDGSAQQVDQKMIQTLQAAEKQVDAAIAALQQAAQAANSYAASL